MGGREITRMFAGCWTMMTCLDSPGMISQRRPRKLISPALAAQIFSVKLIMALSEAGGCGLCFLLVLRYQEGFSGFPGFGDFDKDGGDESLQ